MRVVYVSLVLYLTVLLTFTPYIVNIQFSLQFGLICLNKYILLKLYYVVSPATITPADSSDAKFLLTEELSLYINVYGLDLLHAKSQLR